MNCHEWQSRWQALLDGEAADSNDREWRAHLKDCSACRELQETADRLWTSLRRMPQPALPPYFADDVLTAVGRDQSVRRRERMWIGLGISLAAAMVVFGMARLFVRPAGTDLHAKAAASSIPPPPSLESQIADARSATVDLGRRVAQDTVRHAALFLPPSDRWPGFDSNPAPGESTTMQVREVGRTVSSGLEPVTSSTRRAFDMLRRLLPPTEIEKPNS